MPEISLGLLVFYQIATARSYLSVRYLRVNHPLLWPPLAILRSPPFKLDLYLRFSASTPRSPPISLSLGWHSSSAPLEPPSVCDWSVWWIFAWSLRGRTTMGRRRRPPALLLHVMADGWQVTAPNLTSFLLSRCALFTLSRCLATRPRIQSTF